MKIKYYRKNRKKIKKWKQILPNNIKKFSHKLWNPISLTSEKLVTNSWFSFVAKTNNSHKTSPKFCIDTDSLPKVDYNCSTKILLPTPTQKKIILHWMDSYIKMYNITLKFIKSEMFNKRKCTLDFKNLRTNFLDKLKDDVFKKSNLLINGQIVTINRHLLDGAIKDVCSMIKSAMENKRADNIKHFRLRYLKTTKKQKILKIESILFSKESFCSSVLGKRIKTTDYSDFSDVDCDSTLQYNSVNNRFTLFIPKPINTIYDKDTLKCIKFCKKIGNKLKKLDEIILGNKSVSENTHNNKGLIDKSIKKYVKINQNIKNTVVKIENKFNNAIRNFEKIKKKITPKIKESPLVEKLKKNVQSIQNKINKINNNYNYIINKYKKRNVISIDPGTRTFLTCYTDNLVYEIGSNMYNVIKEHLIKIDTLNASQLSNSRKRKAINKRYTKIDNLINELHWKAINFLTGHYDTILIGNLSTKSIGQNDLHPLVKRVATEMKLYVFRERLKYKCSVKSLDYKLVNEYLTTKMCSNCSHINNNIGRSETYDCPKCKNILGRDINAAKNIYLRSIID